LTTVSKVYAYLPDAPQTVLADGDTVRKYCSEIAALEKIGFSDESSFASRTKKNEIDVVV
jgi:hypothetical protein